MYKIELHLDCSSFESTEKLLTWIFLLFIVIIIIVIVVYYHYFGFRLNSFNHRLIEPFGHQNLLCILSTAFISWVDNRTALWIQTVSTETLLNVGKIKGQKQKVGPLIVSRMC